MNVVAVIPARYNSTRLPGKPLLDLLGKPMVQHVYERVQQVQGLQEIVVATDDARIAETVAGFGGKAMLTRSDHPSGTDRLVEVMHRLPADLYLNVQGDEPLINPAHLQSLIDTMVAPGNADVGTLCHRITERDAENPNTVKCVLDHLGMALYFSRSIIPFAREPGKGSYFKHIGVYAYRTAVLRGYSALPASSLEQAELLEQLRLLQAGARIKVVEVDTAAPGVDTPQCLERIRRIMSGKAEAAAPSLADVRLVITDVDGVLTDGGIWYDPNGESLKRFHVRDGMGIKMLQACGVEVAVVSGRDSATLRKRVQDLGIDRYDFAVKDKAKACRQLMEQAGVPAFNTLVIGDDSIDLPAFSACGVSVAVADAPDYVKQAATITLTKAGGQGAFREISDRLLAAQGLDAIYRTAEGYTSVMQRMAQ